MSEKLQIGSVVEGKVVRIKPFGAIVSLKNKQQGLVHISQISNSFVENIEDFIAVGDTVNVKVLSVDATNNKISLSIRAAEAKNKMSEKAAPIRNDVQEPFKTPTNDLDDKIKEWLKQANERQAGINKRNNRR